MEFFGLTHYGPQNYFADCLREDYKEPMKLEDVEPMLKKIESYSTLPKTIQHPDTNTMRIIDCYLGQVNGFAYGSNIRFSKMKRKRALKPVFPCEMYRIEPTTSIEYGWFIHDTALQNATWHKSPRFPQQSSPNSLILDKARRSNKYASLF